MSTMPTTDPVSTGVGILSGLSGFNSGPAGPAISDAYGYQVQQPELYTGGDINVEPGGINTKTKWNDLLLAGAIGGALVWILAKRK